MTRFLSPRSGNASFAERLERSATFVTEGSDLRTVDVPEWLETRARSHDFLVKRIPLTELDGWSFAPRSGNLVHGSGRFFSVEGLQAYTDEGPIRSWQQPVIRQPEVGVLGLLTKEIDGVLHFLMQAKMEPGNIPLVQISPTVQATRSNRTRVHRGTSVRHLEYFTAPRQEQVLADVLHSEHGSWFHGKVNRNMIVETSDEVETTEDFRWLTLGQIGRLLRTDRTVNMCSRSVLSCLPMEVPDSDAQLTDTGLLSWLTGERARRESGARLMPLSAVEDWGRVEGSLKHTANRYFRIVGVTAEAGNREVGAWCQPLLDPVATGVSALLVRRVHGRVHLLVRARSEAGFLGGVELGPSVQCTPANWSHLYPTDRPRFLDAVLDAAPEDILYSVVHSEEGGRFLDARNHYMIVRCGPGTVPDRTPSGFVWVTPGQLVSLTMHSHYLNVQVRTLLSLITTGCVDVEALC